MSSVENSPSHLKIPITGITQNPSSNHSYAYVDDFGEKEEHDDKWMKKGSSPTKRLI